MNSPLSRRRLRWNAGAVALLALGCWGGFAGSAVTARGALVQGFNNPVISTYPAGSFVGNASIQTAAYGVTPTEGTGQLLLTTYNTGIPPEVGTNPAVNESALESFLGLPAGTLSGRNAVDGSAFRSQPLTLFTGDRVTFDYLFLTNEDTQAMSGFRNDFAFLTVNGTYPGSNPIVSVTAIDASLVGSSTPNFSLQMPGYVTYTFTAPANGSYTFGIGIVDVVDNGTASGLLVDNLFLIPIPEPGTSAILFLALGAGGIGCLWRHRRGAGPALPGVQPAV